MYHLSTKPYKTALKNKKKKKATNTDTPFSHTMRNSPLSNSRHTLTAHNIMLVLIFVLVLVLSAIHTCLSVLADCSASVCPFSILHILTLVRAYVAAAVVVIVTPSYTEPNVIRAGRDFRDRRGSTGYLGR